MIDNLGVSDYCEMGLQFYVDKKEKETLHLSVVEKENIENRAELRCYSERERYEVIKNSFDREGDFFKMLYVAEVTKRRAFNIWRQSLEKDRMEGESLIGRQRKSTVRRHYLTMYDSSGIDIEVTYRRVDGILQVTFEQANENGFNELVVTIDGEIVNRTGFRIEKVNTLLNFLAINEPVIRKCEYIES